MDDLFGVSLSRGAVGRLRDELSQALASPVAEAKAYIQAQPVMHSDETSFSQGNRDGGNPVCAGEGMAMGASDALGERL